MKFLARTGISSHDGATRGQELQGSNLGRSLKVGYVGVGDELINGRISDTLSEKISAALGEAAERIATIFVGDNEEQICRVLEFLESLQCELIIVSGGLGPTKDDITRQALARFANKQLRWSDQAWEVVARHFGSVPIPENNRIQAWLPEGCLLLPNDRGSACGFALEKGRSLVVACLPGVPIEFEQMLKQQLLNALLLHYSDRFSALRSHHSECKIAMQVFGRGESAFEESLFKLIPEEALTKYSICARRGLLEISLDFRNKLDFLKYRSVLASEFAECIVTFSLKPIAEQIAEAAIGQGIRIGVLENATWGRIYSVLAQVPNSEKFLAGGASCLSLSSGLRLPENEQHSLKFAQDLHWPAARFLDADVVLTESGFQPSQPDPGGSQFLSFGFSISTSKSVTPACLERLRKFHNQGFMTGTSRSLAEVAERSPNVCAAIWSSQTRLRSNFSECLERGAVAGLVGLYLFLQCI